MSSWLASFADVLCLTVDPEEKSSARKLLDYEMNLVYISARKDGGYASNTLLCEYSRRTFALDLSLHNNKILPFSCFRYEREKSFLPSHSSRINILLLSSKF